MKREYKQAYQAPTVESFQLRQALTVLDTFSFDTTSEDPSYGGNDWGDLRQQNWGENRPGYPTDY